ncbi:MAG TPA: cytochrome c [Chloroflexota bacterium]|nr:cytochrome c [Chloroflexota bacterium]
MRSPRSDKALGGAAALGLLALLGVACYPGAYPVDVFPEMHYEPAYRRLEPNRLPPPPGAVPITGAKPTYTFAQAGGLTNPVAATPDNLAAARATYSVNCAMCHGPDGRGDSPVATYFRGAGVVPPVDFAGARVRGRSDGQLYWLITNGIGDMPPFRDLLTEQEVWGLVDYVRSVQGP